MSQVSLWPSYTRPKQCSLLFYQSSGSQAEAQAAAATPFSLHSSSEFYFFSLPLSLFIYIRLLALLTCLYCRLCNLFSWTLTNNCNCTGTSKYNHRRLVNIHRHNGAYVAEVTDGRVNTCLNSLFPFSFSLLLASLSLYLEGKDGTEIQRARFVFNIDHSKQVVNIWSSTARYRCLRSIILFKFH